MLAIGYAVYKATKAVKKDERILQNNQGGADDPCFTM
jgi:hypothetical protein